MSVITQISLNGSVYDLRDKKFMGSVTNCITEIPQDIKLELSSDGTLTLKAGSKVYVPNGVGNFDIINITSDISAVYGIFRENLILCIDTSGSVTTLAYISECYSGSTSPSTSTNRQIWYDTTNNIIRTRAGGITEWTRIVSFPIAIVNCTGANKFTINQVFNGFGYIGSTVFALPGVKGLIPNGRNEDGSLKNTEFTVSNVLTKEPADNNMNTISINSNNMQIYNFAYSKPISGYLTYQEDENYNYASLGKFNLAFVGNVKRVGNQISLFSSKTTLHALDYNDSNYIAHQAMPSDRYVNLTLGASGASYIAPADGYITIRKESTNANQYIAMRSNPDVIYTNSSGISGEILAGTIPVKKGEVVKIDYNLGGTTSVFKFIYANGSK